MKLIPKDVVLEEIEKRIRACENCYILDELTSLHRTFDSLEVKEMDLEDAKKEELAQKYIDYTFKRHNIYAHSKKAQLIYYAYMHGMNQCLNQLKAQKGE
jgi:hypothetical protein